jgi:hypothetical protein
MFSALLNNPYHCIRLSQAPLLSLISYILELCYRRVNEKMMLYLCYVIFTAGHKVFLNNNARAMFHQRPEPHGQRP